MMQGPSKSYRYVYLCALFSAVYLAFLVSSAQPGVFFSSDGGVKYLVVKQFTEGHGFKYMYLPQPQWVHEIWANGFFPFRAPFVYHSPGGYLFVFPPAFQIISSFFYAHFGNTGLLVIPVLSTLMLWLGFILLLRRCDISPSRIAIGLFILVFCSPLTIYGATYWEHMTAILLLFSGLSFLTKAPTGSLAAICMGLLSGLASWFRPEALVMNALYSAALIFLSIKERRRAPSPSSPAASQPSTAPSQSSPAISQPQRATILFLVGVALGVGSFLLFNKIEFDSFLGVHSRQVLKDSVEGGVEVNPFRNLIANNLINARHFLFILFILPVIYVWLRYRQQLQPRTLLLIGIVLSYCILTSFLVPNDGGRQWGARYFLPLITVVLVALLMVDKEWKPRYPVWAATIILLMAAYDFQHNTYKGGIKTLVWENQHRIAPDLNYLNEQPGKAVIVSFPYIAMELGYLFDDKYFFLAPDDSSLNRLLPQLKQQGINQYTYIYDVRVPNVRPAELSDTIPDWPREWGDFEFRDYRIP